MIAPWLLDGPMNGDAFATYVTRALVPDLSSGNVVIMDNLSSHKAPAVRTAIESAVAGVRLKLRKLELRQCMGEMVA